MRPLVILYALSTLTFVLSRALPLAGYEIHSPDWRGFVITPIVLYGLWLLYREHMEDGCHDDTLPGGRG